MLETTQEKSLIKLEIYDCTALPNEIYEDETSTELREIEFEMITPVDFSDKRKVDIYNGIAEVDERLAVINQKVEELNTDIDRLTNHADGIDYAISVTCGLVTGLIDAVFVGEWDFKSAKAASNEEINDKVMAFAKKQGYSGGRLDGAIKFLENKYKLPGDGGYKAFGNLGITNATHHLDDFCHHPTIIGLVCCIIVQFTGTATYRSSSGNVVKTPIEINEYEKVVSEEKWGKVFAGVINWFFNVAQTMKNRTGHFMSDMAGSSTAAGKGNDGAGLPGSFLSTAKELSALPCFKDTNFAENLRKAFQNGIGTNKSQLDLGPFNSLFQGASNKVDMRTEMAVKHELKRQAAPVIMNEVLVRGLYFIRRFIQQMKVKDSILDLDWKATLPFHNRTIVRMMTIASGTFTAIDLADAGIRAVVKSGGFNPATLGNFILRVNFVGVGRFAVAVATDTGMGIKKGKKEYEGIKFNCETLELLNAKVFYKEADMWIEAENTEDAIQEVYVVSQYAIQEFYNSWEQIQKSLSNISSGIDNLRKKDPNYARELSDKFKLM